MRVKKKLLLIVCVWIFPFLVLAQGDKDSVIPRIDSPVKQTPRRDTVPTQQSADSANRQPADSPLAKVDTNLLIKPVSKVHGIYQFVDVLKKHPYYNFYGKRVPMLMQERRLNGEESFFYLIIGLFFFYALIRVSFPKYMSDLFTLFFRATLRQQQLREQLLQSPLPSLLLNILFLFTGSLYTALLARYNNVLPQLDFWMAALYCLAILTAIYLGKYMVLKTLGWMLRISKATDSYLFVVFMANKMAGIFLLPVLLMLAFPFKPIVSSVIALSLFVLALLLGYRFFVSYRLVRNEIKLNLFHFFLYLCAFEIAPLLLIYKALLTFVDTF